MSDEIKNIMPKFLVSAPKFLMTLLISFCVFFLFVQAPKEAPFIFENTFNYCISIILALLVGIITGSKTALRHILVKADIMAATLALVLVFIVKSSDLLAPLGVLSSSYDKHNFFLLSLFLSIVILIGCFIGIVVSFLGRKIKDLFIKYFSQQKTIKAIIQFSDRMIEDLSKEYFKHFPQQKTIENSIFLTDEPLKEEDSVDDISKKPDIDYILEKLKGTKTTSQAFAIGITGAWGSGKTSFANSLSSNLDKTNFLWFEPWKFRGVANVQDSLFNELIDHFKKNNKYDLAFDTEAYERLLNHDGVPVYLKFFFNFLKLFKNGSEPDIQEKFKKSLGDEKIYIFIDDLDRLDATEILEVFKLVRSTLSISNLVYILIYDKAHIQSVLEKEVTEGNAKNFLDKIIQTEYHIPSKGLMSDYFIESFAKEFSKHENFSDYEKAVIEVLRANLRDRFILDHTRSGLIHFEGHSIFTKKTDNFKIIFNSHIFTIRDLKRLVNNFLLTINTIRHDWQDLLNQNKNLETKKYEIYFQFLLEILKAKYPDIYDKLYFQDPNWKITADRIKNSDITTVQLASQLINSVPLQAEQAAVATDEHHKILNKESFKKLFSELFARHLFPEDVREKLNFDWNKPNGTEDLDTVRVWMNDESFFTFQNDPIGNEHKVIMNIAETNVQTIDHKREIRAAAYTYRFEKFARENGFLCHQYHYAKYFKPSININSTHVESPIDEQVQSEATLGIIPPTT